MICACAVAVCLTPQAMREQQTYGDLVLRCFFFFKDTPETAARQQPSQNRITVRKGNIQSNSQQSNLKQPWRELGREGKTDDGVS